MIEGGMDRLRTLLFKSGRELVNIKFFPGTGRGLTADQMADEATKALTSALNGDMRHQPPVSGKPARALKEFLNAR